jgi:hypothetical protein
MGAILLRCMSYKVPLTLAAVVLLGACASAPPERDSTGPAVAEDVPELTLNLPKTDCDCNQPVVQDHTFLERGVDAIGHGDYIDALQHIKRYQRLEKSAQSDWEAGISISYLSMLPSSPFYDVEAARKRYRRLSKQSTEGMVIHPSVLLMQESLEALVVMDRHIEDLESNNAILKEDLAKRKDALKRLRELTLGQKGSVL